MPSLVNNGIHLRDGILASRRERENFLAGLEQESGHRRTSVANMLTRFSDGFHDLARRSRADRATFLSNLQQAVAALRRGVRADLGGGRKAFRHLRFALAEHAIEAVGPGRAQTRVDAQREEIPRMSESAARDEQRPDVKGQAHEAGPGKRKAPARRPRRK